MPWSATRGIWSADSLYDTYGAGTQFISEAKEFTNTTATIDASTKKHGAASFRASAVSAGTAYWGFSPNEVDLGTAYERGSANMTNHYLTFWVYFATLPTSAFEDFVRFYSGLDFSALMWALQVDNNGDIRILDQSGATVTTVTVGMSSSTWYRIDWYASVSATSAYELRVDEVSKSSGTMDTGTVNGWSFRLGKVANTNSQSMTANYDSIILGGGAASPRQWIDSGYYVAHMIPNADGTDSDWAQNGGPSTDWDCVDDQDYDTTTYLNSSTVDQVQTVNVVAHGSATPAIADTDVIHHVRFGVVMMRNTAPTVTWCMRRRDTASPGVLDQNNTTTSINGTYSVFSFGTDTATDGSTAYTPSSLDSVQVGLANRNTQSREIRVTSMWVMALATPAPAGRTTKNTDPIHHGTRYGTSRWMPHY